LIRDLAGAFHLYNLSYDLERDFVPITMIEKLPGAIVARANLPVKSVADLITHAKARPGEMTYGSTGPGGWLHVSALLFAKSYHHQPEACPVPARQSHGRSSPRSHRS